MDVSLWFAFSLIALGGSLSFYYGHNLETVMSYAFNDQSVVLKTLNDIEKFDIRVRSHFYFSDRNRVKLNLEEIKNLEAEVGFLLKSLSEKGRYPEVKLLNKKWKGEVSLIVDALTTVEKENIDFNNLQDFLKSFKSLSQKILNNSKETKTVEIVKLKFLRMFTIFIIILAFLIILKKLLSFKIDLLKLSDYFHKRVRNEKVDRLLIKHRSIHDFKSLIDIQSENFLLQKEQCADIINAIEETLVICKPDFSICRCSKEVKQLIGWESFELENKKLSVFFDREEDFDELELKYYRNGKKLFKYPIECKSNTGEVLRVLGTFIDYYDKIRKENVILVILKDGTAEMKIEELREKSKYLFHNSKMASLGEMSGSIAHEINNPLMIIKGSISRLGKIIKRDGLYNEQSKVLIDRVNRMIERVSSIIEIMQNFGDNSENSSEKEFVFIRDLIATAVELNAQKLISKGIKIDFSISNPNIQVKVNKGDMDQAILNLINNAVDGILRGGQEKGSISIRVSTSKKRLFLIIRNDGAPVEKYISSKIFEPFYSTKEKGVGMGLPIAHTLCQRNAVDLRLDCLYPVTFKLEFLGATRV